MPARRGDDPSPPASPEAGPSRLHRSPSSHMNGGTQTQKRKRASQWAQNADDIFEVTDIEEKRSMGRSYRDLQAKVDDMKTNAANVTFEDLEKQLRAQNDLFSTVRDTSIATLDANVSLAAADAALHLARKLKLEGSSFDIDEFFIRLRSLLGLDREQMENMDATDDEDELEESLERSRPSRRNRARRGVLGDWAKIGWMAAKLSRRVPGAEFMYGPLKVEHKKRTLAQRRGRKELAPEQRPQDVQQQQGQQKKDDTLTGVFDAAQLLMSLDKQQKGVNLFEFAINPNDFGQSVENMFYVSFLVKDGRAGIQVGADGEMRIYAKFSPEEDSEEEEDPDDMLRNQTVMELDMETWKEAIEVFDIRRSMIPHRSYGQTQAPGSGSWY